MSEWVFIDIPGGTVEGFPGSEFPFPIRKDRMEDFEALRAEQFPLPVLIDELNEYLDENPGRAARYKDCGSHLALCAGIDTCIDNCTERALDYFRISLWFDPANVTARMNYAVALHSLDRREEAMEQYRIIMETADIGQWWRAWMLCAEALLALGRNAEALEMLLEAEKVIPDDNQFWNTLALAEERAKPACPHCGAAMPVKLRFCGHCGGRLE